METNFAAVFVLLVWAHTICIRRPLNMSQQQGGSLHYLKGCIIL
jgi:hypothetical protein